MANPIQGPGSGTVATGNSLNKKDNSGTASRPDTVANTSAASSEDRLSLSADSGLLNVNMELADNLMKIDTQDQAQGLIEQIQAAMENSPRQAIAAISGNAAAAIATLK